VTRVYAWLDSTEWVARLIVRMVVGFEFFGSGLGKLGKLGGLIQYFRSLGIPAAEILAPLVASTELVCGVLVFCIRNRVNISHGTLLGGRRGQSRTPDHAE
jgi:uncharacterized membrane protein YphA (DoxX/SURF4 family)